MASAQPLADTGGDPAGTDPSLVTDNPTITHSQYTTDASTAASASAGNADTVVSPGTPGTPGTDVTGDKKKNRLSMAGIKGLVSKLTPTRSKSAGRSPSAENPAGSYGEAGAGTVAGDHPRGIIPHTARPAVGETPVQVNGATYNPSGGVIGDVDLILTKEAEKIMQAMADMVENSGKTEPSGDIPAGTRDTLYPHAASTHEIPMPKKGWMANWGASLIDKIFVSNRMGVYVITNRQTGDQIFETMPIFTRLGMHLLFVSTTHEILDLKAVEKLFNDVTIRQGKIYDNPDPAFVLPHIQTFIKTYSIPVDELLEPDLKKYKTVNAFFARSLRPSARPVSEANDFTVITSPADSRMVAFRSVPEAEKFWIKGKKFSLSSLLDDQHLAETFGKNPSIAVFRLAPQDYHRFHSPCHATLGKLLHVPGTYYTVNPQAINEDLNVFTANRRDVQILNATLTNPENPNTPNTEVETVPIAFIAVGAMLVGSIGWSKTPGQTVQKGEDLGFFQYGGSTTIAVFPEGTVEWDEDLLKASEDAGLTKDGHPTETLVRVGERIGRYIGKGSHVKYGATSATTGTTTAPVAQVAPTA